MLVRRPPPSLRLREAILALVVAVLFGAAAPATARGRRPPPSPPEAPPEIDPRAVEQALRRASRTYRIPGPLLRALVEVDARLPDADAFRLGFGGPMRLAPGVVASLRVKDPWSPDQNLAAAALWLRLLADRFGGDLVGLLSAYHEGRIQAARAKGVRVQGSADFLHEVLGVYYRILDGRPRVRHRAPP